MGKDLIKSSEDSILKDIVNEEGFLSAVDKKTEIVTELEMMLRIYEEQLKQLVGLRFDAEMFDYLILAEPNETKHAQSRTQVKQALGKKRKLVSIIRKQIIEIAKGADGKKD